MGDRDSHVMAGGADYLDYQSAKPTDPRVVEARWVPVEELASMDFRPDIVPQLVASLGIPGPPGGQYLGNSWVD